MNATITKQVKAQIDFYSNEHNVSEAEQIEQSMSAEDLGLELMDLAQNSSNTQEKWDQFLLDIKVAVYLCPYKRSQFKESIQGALEYEKYLSFEKEMLENTVEWIDSL